MFIRRVGVCRFDYVARTIAPELENRYWYAATSPALFGLLNIQYRLARLAGRAAC